MEDAKAELAEQTQIVTNAVRLIKDAKLLVEHERHASAFALSVIALEEFGKVILRRWEADRTRPPPRKRRTSHLAKQEAAACVLLGHFTVTRIGDIVANHEGSEEERQSLIVNAIAESGAGQLSQSVWFEDLEKVKHLALYRDLSPISDHFKPESFNGSDPVGIVNACMTVADAIWNERMMTIGRTLYDARPTPFRNLAPQISSGDQGAAT